MKRIVLIAFIFPLLVFSQQDKATLEKEARQLVREGNELYNQLKFADAEVKYKKALEKNPAYEIANYNLGNALAQQNRNKEAVERYQTLAKMTKDKSILASTMHNIGNVNFKEKKYQEAVEAYKNSLRVNPKDDETRYNLALAQMMLKNQQQNKDQNKDNKDNKDKKDNQNKDNKDEKNQDKKDNQNQQKKPQPGKLSPEQIKQLLEAMNNEEKKTQEKMNAKKERGKKIKQEKDW